MDYKALYIEATAFLHASGGSYRDIDTATYRDIIDALFDGRYRVTRNNDGELTSFTTWWMIHEYDIELVKNGGKPNDVNAGSVVYIADHAGVCSTTTMIKFIKSMTDWGCWHHRYKQPSQFRQYKQRGASDV